FFQAEDGIRDFHVTGVQTCALPIFGVILNPAANAGRALSLLPVLTGALEAAGLRFQVHVTSGPGDATVAARRLVEQGVPVALTRSEERRVGKECRSRRWAEHEEKK